MNQQQLILSLLKDDLTNARLVHALNAAGLQASHYFLHLSDTIFRLMQIPEERRNDTLYDWYHLQTRRAAQLPADETAEMIDQLVLEIYKGLQLFTLPA